MMIVVDTNVLVYLTLPGPFTAKAESVLQKDGDWAAPVLWRSEMRSALLKVVRTQLIDLDVAFQAMDVADQILDERQFDVTSERVVELACKSGCSSYDCEYVALAQYLEVPLLTNDAQILKAFPKVAEAL